VRYVVATQTPNSQLQLPTTFLYTYLYANSSSPMSSTYINWLHPIGFPLPINAATARHCRDTIRNLVTRDNCTSPRWLPVCARWPARVKAVRFPRRRQADRIARGRTSAEPAVSTDPWPPTRLAAPNKAGPRHQFTAR